MNRVKTIVAAVMVTAAAATVELVTVVASKYDTGIQKRTFQ